MALFYYQDLLWQPTWKWLVLLSVQFATRGKQTSCPHRVEGASALRWNQPKPSYNWTVCIARLTFFSSFSESHTICIIYHVMFFSSLFLTLSNRCDKTHLCFYYTVLCGEGVRDRLIMWHYKEANHTPLKSLYVISDISAPFGGTENCFHSECASQGHKRDIWIWEHVEGSLQTKQSPHGAPGLSRPPHQTHSDLTVIIFANQAT